MKSYKDGSKNCCYINKQKYYQSNKIGISNIHFNILQPTMANRTANTNVKDTTKALLLSTCELVKRVAAPIPKKICDEAMQQFDQYLFISLRSLRIAISQLYHISKIERRSN